MKYKSIFETANENRSERLERLKDFDPIAYEHEIERMEHIIKEKEEFAKNRSNIILELTIKRKPYPSPRPRTNFKGWVYLPNEYKKEKEAITKLIKDNYKGNVEKGALSMTIHFGMPIPKSMPKKRIRLIESLIDVWHTKKPDMDNLEKTYKDCMENVVYKNDSQICYCAKKKIYATEPYVYIKLERFEQND